MLTSNIGFFTLTNSPPNLKILFSRKLTVQRKISELEKKIFNAETELDKCDDKYREDWE